MKSRIVVGLILALGLLGCGQSGPALQKVRGTVLVNGQPAERVAVSLLNLDAGAKGNAAHPCAVTNGKGEFELSTEKDGDGAVAGEYYVGFVWWSDPDPDKAKDLLQGVYADPKQTGFKIKVNADGANELTLFELKADPKQAAIFVQP